MGNRVYAGASGRCRRESVVYACPCGERFGAEVYRVVDSSDPDAMRRLVDGRLNVVRCPSCEAPADVQVPVVLHDLETPRMILVVPDGLRHRELEERAAFFTALAADREPAAHYVLEAPVVFGAAGLRTQLGPPPTSAQWKSATPAALTTGAPAPVPVAVVPEKTPTIPIRDASEPAKELAREKEKPPRDRVSTAPELIIDDEAHTRVRIAVPDPRAAMIERWIAGREGPSALLVDDSVMACAALPPAALECFANAPKDSIQLRVQLHRMPTYPVLSVTLVAPPPPEGKRNDDARVVCVALDIARAAHRVVLDALMRKCAVAVELYDQQYLPVASLKLTAALEENVRRLASEAKDALERIAPPQRSFERARQQLTATGAGGYDRLGRTSVELPDETLEALERPAAVLAALAEVSRWSEPSAEAYLVEIRSLPLAQWRAQRARIIHRALDMGIAVSRLLVERSAKEHASPLPSWQELLGNQVRRFAEISARQRPNDLSAAQEAENWDLLLRECALAGVIVDDQIRRLADQSLRRARTGNGNTGVDMRTMETRELVALLERRELRREAALVLCERLEPSTVPALFSAIRRMARGEANLVLPAVTSFGPAAERWLIDGLKSKKSFMRQGCALGLGVLKTPLGVDALVRALLFEPTEIWTEVARSLGDVGAQAVMPLAARLREADTERRERVILALAHIASRPTGGKAPIEMLAAGRDALVGQAAQRALALSAEVRAADDQMRTRARPMSEQTVVRGFSRRFYEALESGVSGAIELDPSELEELPAEDTSPNEAADGLDEDDREHHLLTATHIPALGRGKLRELSEDTSPQPKAVLPRDGG
jgi:hypothetical protein